MIEAPQQYGASSQVMRVQHGASLHYQHVQGPIIQDLSDTISEVMTLEFSVENATDLARVVSTGMQPEGKKKTVITVPKECWDVKEHRGSNKFTCNGVPFHQYDVVLPIQGETYHVPDRQMVVSCGVWDGQDDSKQRASNLMHHFLSNSSYVLGQPAPKSEDAREVKMNHDGTSTDRNDTVMVHMREAWARNVHYVYVGNKDCIGSNHKIGTKWNLELGDKLSGVMRWEAKRIGAYSGHDDPPMHTKDLNLRLGLYEWRCVSKKLQCTIYCMDCSNKGPVQSFKRLMWGR